MDKIHVAWTQFMRCAQNAGVGALLESAYDAAERELKELDPVYRHRPKQRRDKARENVIASAKLAMKPPATWREISNYKESAVLAAAVNEAIDAYHKETGECGP
jgi:hypothetical protein